MLLHGSRYTASLRLLKQDCQDKYRSYRRALENIDLEDKMSKLASFMAEMLRLVVLLVLTLGILGGVEQWIFKMLYGWTGYLYTAVIGNFLVFFVMYRNYWQFKGWYKSEKNQKLKPVWTRSLSAAALLLILVPFAVPIWM
jgi:hypothetical protein